MTKEEVLQLLNESLTKLKEYNSKADEMYADHFNRVQHGVRGADLLEHISLGRLFVDEDNRDTNYDDMFDGDIFKELHDELKKTSYIKQLLLGDISPEKYRKLIDQI